MNDEQSRTLKTGGDPRTLADFAALREELSKLTHPARPDVNWQHVEQLSLSLFRQNGIELQTAAWYTLARTHLAGMHGLNEGLAILDALITYQWGALWPQPVHARMEILAGLSQRLLSVLRTVSLSYTDLPVIYQAEQHLDKLRDALQRLELKNASQIGELCTFMHNAAVRLENADANQGADFAAVIPATAGGNVSVAPSEPLVYVAREAPVTPRVVISPPEPKRQWKGFTASVLAALLLGGASMWGWQALHPIQAALPLVANQSSLTELAQQSPLWLQEYGFALAAQAKSPTAEGMKKQWQQHIEGNALPAEDLSGWHQGMEQLQQLTDKLNGLDEKRGKYMTVSELKSVVFSARQAFNQSVPLEEQLYLLSQTEAGTPLPAAQILQTDRHINQLLNRYMLIKQQAN